MTEFVYKKNLKPKETHPIFPLVRDIFVTAGPEYVQLLMDHLQKTIEEESDKIKPEDNINGVIYETLRMVRDQEPLNDRYLMGAGLFIVSSLIPIAQVMSARLEDLSSKEASNDNQDS